MNISRVTAAYDCMFLQKSEQWENQAVNFALKRLHDRGHGTGVKKNY